MYCDSFMLFLFYLRYTSAAQELVMYARGILKRGWRKADDNPASGDDITVFVIPLKPAITSSEGC